MTDSIKLQDWPKPGALMFRKVDLKWRVDELLEQEGWFPLPDVMKLLDPDNTGKYRKILSQREKLGKIGQDTIQSMGLKQFGKRIWADMPTFSEWFLNNESLWLDRIPKNWTLQTFLNQEKGTFSLNRVLSLLPGEWRIKYSSMTRLIHGKEDSKQEIGADKLDGVGYVVFMPKFGEWLRKRFD